MAWWGRLRFSVSRLFQDNHSRRLLLFGCEGALLQFVWSIAAAGGFGTNLYATNLGATDAQIGMTQLVPYLAAVALLLPVGLIGDRMKDARIVPAAIMAFLGAMYMLYGTVPAMGEHRMTFFFVFLALTAGFLSTYNSIWQSFFGDVTPLEQRNRVYAFRNRFVYVVAMAAPVLCGALLTALPDSESKLAVLRAFFYLCGALCLLNAFVISRMRGGRRSPEATSAARFSPREIGGVLRGLVRDRKFMAYFGGVMLFYMGWHMDWSMWYIGQTQYIGLNEAELSLYTALTSISQLLLMGAIVKLIDRRGTGVAFLCPILSLVFCPVVMLVGLHVPEGARAVAFLAMGTLVCSPQSGTNLCLVQMLLSAVPQRNRSLIISLHMMVVTLSNALMPYLGVRLYEVMGADRHALVLFNVTVLCIRLCAFALFSLRALRARRAAESERRKAV